MTQNQTEALAIADRAAVMSRGNFVECASPLDIYDAPDARFTAEYVGGRNAIELPVIDGNVTWEDVFSADTPADRVCHASQGDLDRAACVMESERKAAHQQLIQVVQVQVQ